MSYKDTPTTVQEAAMRTIDQVIDGCTTLVPTPARELDAEALSDFFDYGPAEAEVMRECRASEERVSLLRRVQDGLEAYDADNPPSPV